MSVCPNCNKTLSCGCQRRTASNKVAVCSGCLGSYEKSLKSAPPITPTEKPDLNTWGKDRYKNLSKFLNK